MSSWVDHVKDYAKKNNVSYKIAMSSARATYVKKDAPKKKEAKAVRPAVSMQAIQKAKRFVKKHNLNWDDTVKEARDTFNTKYPN